MKDVIAQRNQQGLRGRQLANFARAYEGALVRLADIENQIYSLRRK